MKKKPDGAQVDVVPAGRFPYDRVLGHDQIVTTPPAPTRTSTLDGIDGKLLATVAPAWPTPSIAPVAPSSQASSRRAPSRRDVDRTGDGRVGHAERRERRENKIAKESCSPSPPNAPEAEIPVPSELVTAAIIDAFRKGDLDALHVLGAATFGGSDAAQDAPLAAPVTQAKAPAVPRSIQERVQRERQALVAMDPGAGADERLLLGLTADSLSMALMLSDLSEHLTVHLPGLLGQPQAMKVVATALRDAISLRNSTLNRMQSLLTTVASLRGQRRFLPRRGAQNGD